MFLCVRGSDVTWGVLCRCIVGVRAFWRLVRLLTLTLGMVFMDHMAPIASYCGVWMVGFGKRRGEVQQHDLMAITWMYKQAWGSPFLPGRSDDVMDLTMGPTHEYLSGSSWVVAAIVSVCALNDASVGGSWVGKSVRWGLLAGI